MIKIGYMDTKNGNIYPFVEKQFIQWIIFYWNYSFFTKFNRIEEVQSNY